jgi:diguanylate cyclase (GGDEF)-like protein
MTTAEDRAAPPRIGDGGRPLADRGDTVALPDDILVFEHSDAGFSLVGGTGRGASWAGIVDIPADRSLVSRAWDSGTALRQSASTATHVAGPYHAEHAIAVPVGERHVVVLGANHPLNLGESELFRIAADAVDKIHGIPADKLLADELELVQSLRRLMAYRPENVEDTLRHIATTAADALSCEVAAIRVERHGDVVSVTIGSGDDASALTSELERYLAALTATGVSIVEQTGEAVPGLFGLQIASHMALPIGTDPSLGALALAHASTRPRGFTSLCQRIGRAVAEAAELLITQAAAREQLAAERDLLVRMSGTDSLTGIANRRAWNDEVKRLAEGEPTAAYILSCDLDRLKEANDRFGHEAGDALIRATANLLSACVREHDFLARIGGDEFAVLLWGADERAARRVLARIRRAERAWRVTEFGLGPRLSVGAAPVIANDVEQSRQLADARMYRSKRRRRANPTSYPSSASRGDRRHAPL